MNLLLKATNNLSQSQVASINSQLSRTNRHRLQEGQNEKSGESPKKDHRAMIRLRHTLQTTMRRNAVNTKSHQAIASKSPKSKRESNIAATTRPSKKQPSKENRNTQLQQSNHKVSTFGFKASRLKFKSSNISPKKELSKDVSILNVSRSCGKSIMNRQTSMIRSKQFLYDLEKKMEAKSLSRNLLKLPNDPSFSTLPAIRKSKNNLIGSNCAEELLQSSFMNPRNHLKESVVNSAIQSQSHSALGNPSLFQGTGPMDSNVLMIHVDDRPSQKIILNPFANTKSERQLQLNRFLNYGRNSSRIVDNVFIRSLFENKIHFSERNELEKIKSTINQNFDENLTSMQQFASTICRRTRRAVQKIIQPSQSTKKEYKTELIQKIKNFLLFFKTLNIPSSEILKFPIRPYFHPKASDFVKAAKFGDIDKITQMLFHHSKLLIYEFDYLHLTALHWATKRNHTECAEELIRLRAYVNSQDLYGRTPLYYAIQNKNVILVYYFLVHKAIPWSTENCNYIKLADGDETIVYFIKRFRYLDLIMKLLRIEERDQFRRSFIETKIRRPAFARTDLEKIDNPVL